MYKTLWKISALVSAILLGGTFTTYASESEPESEIFSFYNEYYDDEVDEVDEEDEKDEVDEEDEKEDDDKSDGNSGDIVLPTSYTADIGRLLGSQCAQCHGTNGMSVNSWDSIAGESDLEDEIYEDDEPIMMAQAHGYTSEEIILISEWLKTLKDND